MRFRLKIYLTFGRFSIMIIKNRNEILIKSAEIISNDGMEGYTMQILADSLGIRKASLYHHYKSKEEIIEAMHDYYHGLLLKRGYRIELSSDAQNVISELVGHWSALFFSDEMYDYLRCLLTLRQNDERAYEEWRSIALTIEGQSRIIIEKFTKRGDIISPLFSAYLELSLERALITGESTELDGLTTSFSALLSHGF